MRKLILVIIVFAGCSKKEDVRSPISIKVLESTTNLPISGADLVFNKLSDNTILFQGVTNANGICLVPSLQYNDAGAIMSVVKEQYWDKYRKKDTIVHLTPYGWLQLHIHKVGNYTTGSRLFLFEFNQDGSSAFGTDFNTAEDSLIVAFCFGNQENNIDWRVVDKGQNRSTDGTLGRLLIPRLDTLKNVTLDY